MPKAATRTGTPSEDGQPPGSEPPGPNGFARGRPSEAREPDRRVDQEDGHDEVQEQRESAVAGENDGSGLAVPGSMRQRLGDGVARCDESEQDRPEVLRSGAQRRDRMRKQT